MPCRLYVILFTIQVLIMCTLRGVFLHANPCGMIRQEFLTAPYSKVNIRMAFVFLGCVLESELLMGLSSPSLVRGSR